MRNKLEHKGSLSNEPQASMMKFVGIVSLFLVCVLIVHVVDGRKHNHKRHGKERVRSEVGKQIVSKALPKTEKAAEGTLDAVNADHNEATAVNKDKAVPIADSQEKPGEHLVQIKHRRGHEGHRRKEKGKHNHKRGFRKRNHGNRKRHHSNVNKKLKRVPNQKDLQKFVTKRMKHLRRKQQKKDNTP